MKRIRLSRYALERCQQRGTNADEVFQAVREGKRQKVKRGRLMCRLNLQYNGIWQGQHYAIKQVAPVIAEDAHEIVVVTVYTFFF